MREPGYDTEKTVAPGGLDRDFNPRDMREVHEKLAKDRCTEAFVSGQAQIGLDNSIGRDPFDELFRYHPPTPQDLPKFQAVNQAAKNFAEVLRANCPRCEDFVNAMERIREARMWANSAIALQGRI
jgi:hypothetical protein